MATGRPVTSTGTWGIPVTDTPNAEPVINAKDAEPVVIIPSGGYPVTFVTPGLVTRGFSSGFNEGFG